MRFVFPIMLLGALLSGWELRGLSDSNYIQDLDIRENESRVILYIQGN